MKKISIIALLLLLFIFNFTSFAQDVTNEFFEVRGENFNEIYDAKNPEITYEQYEMLEKSCAENTKLLGLGKIEKSSDSVRLYWPVRASASFTDCSFYAISACVDHNPAQGEYTDYNCGTKSYDGHRGTDIFTWPFPFYKMENSQAEVIATAEGIILAKDDGHYDRNCAGNNSPANYVIIQHTDGSRALYWHMKSGSVTTKQIGDTVSVGEYLGVIGSSGNSSGPHLHFEIWSGGTNSTCIDPYSGPCNNLNVNSWWAEQKPYTEPGILKASVHSANAVIPGCPNTETPNECTEFTIPYQGNAFFYLFLRNAEIGTTAHLEILNPDNTTYHSWDYDVSVYYNVSYFWYSMQLPSIEGNYKFKASYNGETCEQDFELKTSTGINDITEKGQFQIYPNPAEDEISVYGVNSDYIEQIIINDVLGNEVMRIDNYDSNKKINVSELCNGMYILRVINNRDMLKKAIIQILK